MARLTSQFWVGILIVAVGVLLLLDTTGDVSDIDFSLYIPSVFILLAVYAMIRSLVGPVIVIILAGAWQLSRLDMLPEDLVSTWWPLFLVLVGLAIIVGRWRTTHDPTESSTDDLDVVGLFGGTNRHVTSDAFRHGDVTVAFGGLEIDILTVFGGAEIVVPRDWTVDIDILPIFGVASDDPLRDQTPDTTGPPLTVSGVVLFDGVTIKE